jgi:hypothetical protein
MKIIQSVLFAILTAILISACGASNQPSPTPLGESMKGYELYSWQEANQWKFSLLVGTNREKTLEEIKSADILLSSVDELESVLETIPSGQYITWSSRETLSLPPEDILKRVEQICEDQGLILTVGL